jgi:hypothetical protein
MRWSLYLSLAAMLCIAVIGRAADARPGDTPSALSPAMQAALERLSSQDFATREQACNQLNAILVQEAVALASVRGGEAQARMLAALEFDDGLIHWVKDVLKLPQEQRIAELQLASNPNVLPILSDIFSAQPANRTNGIAALMKLDPSAAPHNAVDVILARLIEDPDRQVAVAAMESAWDREPSDVIVNALWRRAVATGVEKSLQYPVITQHELTFRGQKLPGYYSAAAITLPTSDGDVAAQVLVHMQSPQVKEKLIALLKQAAEITALPNATNAQNNAYSAAAPSMQNALALFEDYKPPEAYSSVFALATEHVRVKYSYLYRNISFIASNRTNAIVALVHATGLRCDDYQLKQVPRAIGGLVWVSPSEKDEDAAVAKLQDWWKANGAKYAESAVAAPR